MILKEYVCPPVIFKETIISFKTNSSPSVLSGYAGPACALILWHGPDGASKPEEYAAFV